ncbi:MULTISPECIES: sortase domain-bontaining protein [unclassified Streptomyces]|uniref:sortase domain-containing protein n=1 Tax=unclassified Streptomyces TaxID=2593676 RepID=UPI00371D3A66
MTAPGAVVRAPSGGGAPGPSRAEPAPARQTRPAGPGIRVLGVALSILGALLLGFVLDAGPLGDLRHVRDRQVDYAALRGALANGVAPVGGTVPPGTPVALLSIPALHLREVVREGTTADDLSRGPGHRRDTPLPGQAGVSVVMGRQTTFGGPFLHLRELRPGVEFTVTTGQGRHTYRVLGLRRAGDPQPAAPAAGHGRLTLVTADGTPFMPRGILRVDADLVSRVQATPTPGVAPGALPEDETPMAAQPSAWLPLVLWGQALVLVAAAVAWSHARWGRRHTWVFGVPLLGVLGLAVADQATALLPNLM